MLRFMGSQRVGHDSATDLICSDDVEACVRITHNNRNTKGSHLARRKIITDERGSKLNVKWG